MTTFTEPICFGCKHYDLQSLRCPAFPDQDVPEDILLGEDDHTKPWPGQVGDTVYEPNDKASTLIFI